MVERGEKEGSVEKEEGEGEGVKKHAWIITLSRHSSILPSEAFVPINVSAHKRSLVLLEP